MAARMRRVEAEQGTARRELRRLAGRMAAVGLPRVEAQRVARGANCSAIMVFGDTFVGGLEKQV